MTSSLMSLRDWERILAESGQRGTQLLDDLASTMDEWRTLLGEGVTLRDAYGVPVMPVDHVIPDLRYRMPLRRHGMAFATVFAPHPLDDIATQPQFHGLSLKTALTLMELTEWAETEAERRGEKIRWLMERGWSAEVEHLLALCGLVDPDRVMIAFRTASPTPFQSMEFLRRFVIAHVWRYHRRFPWLAYLPDGIMVLTSGSYADSLAAAERWHTLWTQQDSGFPIRIYVQAFNRLEQLPEVLRELRSLMQFAQRFGLAGLINPVVDDHFVKVLIEMTPDSLSDMVEHTLGALLLPENHVILQTLREYLAHGQSLAKTAQNLYVHPNTVLYRVHQAEKLLGVNLKDTEQLTNLWIAFRGHLLLQQATH